MKQGWEIKKLGDICTVIAGQSPEGKFYNANGDGLPFYQGKKEYGEKYIDEPTTWTTKVTKEAEANDILMSVRAPVGPINFATQKICIGRGLAAIRATQLIDCEFLFNFLLKHESEIVGNAGAVFNSINKAQIESIELLLPPLPEQQRIVAILNEAFAAIAQAKANAEQNLKNAKELFESYLQSVFENKGEGWEEKTLGELCYIKHGFAFEGKDFETDYFGNNPIILTPGNFTENSKLIFNHKNTKRCFSNYPKEYEFTIGELVVVMTDLSSKMKILGKPAFIETENILHNQRIGKFVFFDKTINKTFLFYILQTRKYLHCIKNSATGTMVRHTAPKRILDFNINLPPLKEQKAIVQKLDALSAETKQLEVIYQQKINDLDELKKSILQKAFAGELH